MEQRPSLLIVDDETGMRQTLSEIFKERKYTVDVAATGKEAIEIIKKRILNVVLLDIKLPDMSGIDVLKAIKKDAPATEVIMITAYASLQSSITALNEGAYSYIMKPFEVEDLANTMASAIEKQSLLLENNRLKEFNENIVESMLEGIIIEDEKGTITFINPPVAKILRLSQKDIIGKSLGTFLESDTPTISERSSTNAGRQNRYEASTISKNGNIKYLMVGSIPLFEDGIFTGVLSVLTDITDVKMLESTLKEKIDELEEFNKLMVGREFKMVELKKRISKLEQETKKEKKSSIL